MRMPLAEPLEKPLAEALGRVRQLAVPRPGFCPILAKNPSHRVPDRTGNKMLTYVSMPRNATTSTSPPASRLLKLDISPVLFLGSQIINLRYIPNTLLQLHLLRQTLRPFPRVIFRFSQA